MRHPVLVSEVLQERLEPARRELSEWLAAYRAAQRLPDGHKLKAAWQRLGEEYPAFAADILRAMPRPSKPRGRPKGSGRVASADLLNEIVLRAAETGEPIETAARHIVENTGRAGAINRAHYVAKVARQREEKK